MVYLAMYIGNCYGNGNGAAIDDSIKELSKMDSM
jgi:hypothetical protein